MTTNLKGATGRWVCVVGALSMAWAVGLYGCGSDSQRDPQATASIAPAAGVTLPRLPVPPAVTINHVMVAQIDHASHELWDAAREAKTPQTEKDWRELQHHAIQVAAAGTWIAIGGNGQADPGFVKLVGWTEYAQKMTDAAVAALRATEGKDLKALLTAGDALIETCEGCHKEFKPSLPSEGYMHPHYIGPSPTN
jgi:hypothetical protein